MPRSEDEQMALFVLDICFESVKGCLYIYIVLVYKCIRDVYFIETNEMVILFDYEWLFLGLLSLICLFVCLRHG